MSNLIQARTAYRSPAARSVPRPSMGVLYTDRPRGYGEAVVLPEPVQDEDAENLPEDLHPTLPESDPSVTSRQLLKNLRPRLRYLQQTDRILLELAMTGERSKREVARTLEIEPGTVTRRLDRIIRRLSSGLVNALLADTCPLRPDLRELALEHFLGDLSRKELADLHRMTVGSVSRAIEYVKGWYGDDRAPLPRAPASRASNPRTPNSRATFTPAPRQGSSQSAP